MRSAQKTDIQCPCLLLKPEALRSFVWLSFYYTLFSVKNGDRFVNIHEFSRAICVNPTFFRFSIDVLRDLVYNKISYRWFIRFA